MGENLASSPCPCCSFLSSSNLFLPLETTTTTPTPSTKPEQDESSNKVIVPSPREALLQISSAAAVLNNDEISQSHQQALLVDTHGHAHLNRERQAAYIITSDTENDDEEDSRPNKQQQEENPLPLVSLTCAVSESDWPAAISYASQSNTRLFGLGIHPWYVQNLPDNWLTTLELLLKQHPSAIVGEIGLCKAARFIRMYPDGKAAAMELQRGVFAEQMRLAARLSRPVSVHCVKQHGVFVSVLKEELEGLLPPAIGMHSFTGTAHHAQELLALEPTLKTRFYFGFSHAVNVAMCTSEKSQRQTAKAIQAIPMDRLLAESDVHHSQDLAAGTAGAIAYMAAVLRLDILTVAQTTAKNGIDFIRTR